MPNIIYIYINIYAHNNNNNNSNNYKDGGKSNKTIDNDNNTY